MDKAVIAKRIRTIRREISRRGLDCLILTKPVNVTHATGFMGEDSWGLVTKTRVYLVTDSRYTEQACGECPSCRIVERKKSLADAVARIVEKAKSIGSVGVEKHISLADFDVLKKCVKPRPKPVADIPELARGVKDDHEIKAIRKSGSIASLSLRQTLGQIRPGISESELAGRLDLQMRKLGATTGFDTIVAFGANASRPHHQPGKRKLRKNDTVLIDFGASYDGYCSDITRCFIVGRPTKLFQEVFDAVELAQAAAISKVRAGARLFDVDAAPRRVIEKAGFEVYGHGTGHGFGLEIHEAPFLKPEAKGVLKAGQIITIEPGIYMPGRLGVRIEDDVLVTKTGCEVLTRRCSHSPILPG